MEIGAAPKSKVNRLGLAALCAVLVCTSVQAAAKRDLRGFYPGMPEPEYKEKYKSVGCGWTSCEIDGGSLGFTFTQKLMPTVLKEISFKFQSGTPPAEMIEQISRQFSARPTKSDHKADIAYAMGHMEYMALFVKWMTVVGGKIADWDLGDGFRLQLKLNEPGSVNKYALFLWSQRLLDEEKGIEKRKREADRAKARAVNPAPKF